MRDLETKGRKKSTFFSSSAHDIHSRAKRAKVFFHFCFYYQICKFVPLLSPLWFLKVPCILFGAPTDKADNNVEGKITEFLNA